MSKMRRTVSFYYLSLKEHNENGSRDNMRVLSKSEVRDKFGEIYDRHTNILSNGSRAQSVHTMNNEYVVEIVCFENNKAFMKIGQQNAANTVALRDKQTLESENVPMKASQLLELYTFCLIDFDTGIVSYVGINGAPRISAIRFLFDNVFAQQGIDCILAAIMTSDIAEVLMKKSIISQISVTLAVPNDSVLSDQLGLSMKDFDALENVKTRDVCLSIGAKRNKNLFKRKNYIGELIVILKSKYGDGLKKLTAKARDQGEPPNDYNLLQYSFTRKVTINADNFSEYSQENFQTILMDTYSKNRSELVRYIPHN